MFNKTIYMLIKKIPAKKVEKKIEWDKRTKNMTVINKIENEIIVIKWNKTNKLMMKSLNTFF